MLHKFPIEIRTAILLKTGSPTAAITVECILLKDSPAWDIALPFSRRSIDEFPASRALTRSHFLSVDELLNSHHIVLHWFIRFRRHLIECKLWDISKGFARKGDVSALRILVENGFEISGDLLFKHAIVGKHKTVIAYLQNLGFNGFYDVSAWLQRRYTNDVELVQLALDTFGNSILTDPVLLKSCNKKDTSVAKYLLNTKKEWGCIPKCMELATFYGNVELVKLLLGVEFEGVFWRIAMETSIENGDFGMVKFLVEGGVEPCIKLLVENGEAELVEILAGRAFEQMDNTQDPRLDAVYKEYWAHAIDNSNVAKSFLEATRTGDLKTVTFLDSGASTVFLERLLHTAISSGHKEIAQHLSDRITNPNHLRIFDPVVFEKNIDVILSLSIFGERAAFYAHEKDRVDVLRALHERQPGSITVQALYAGISSLEITKFLVEEIGLACTPEVMDRSVFDKDVLIYLYERFGIPCTKLAMEKAIFAEGFSKIPGKGLEVFKYLHREMGLQCDSAILAKTAKSFSIDMFRYAFENCTGHVTEEVWKNAVQSGIWEIVAYLLEVSGSKTIPADWLSIGVFGSTTGKGLHMLKFLVARNMAQFTDSTLISAAKSGDLECVKYLHSHFGLTYTGTVDATCLRFPAVLSYLHDVVGVKLTGMSVTSTSVATVDKKTALLLLENEALFLPQVLFNDNIFATDFGSVQTLKFLVDRGGLPDIHGALYQAILHKRLEAVKYLYGVAACTSDALDVAAEVGCLEIVRFLHENGAECTVKAVDEAAKAGHVDVVYYLLSRRKEGFSLDADSADLNVFVKRMLKAF
ncbi:hypothetical protein HDU97_006519 [Phlyctochytrium planicorne]|nr:hypothetical protein HDU97_006519 [Phlyctochytrium planicorne]